LQHDLIKKRKDHIWSRRGITLGVGLDIVVPHVVEDAADVGVEIIDVCDEDEVNSHARALPKNCVTSLSYRITRSRVPKD
jgi:hypothetical protein